jgi:Gas vesicle synthesis protein GvpO
MADRQPARRGNTSKRDEGENGNRERADGTRRGHSRLTAAEAGRDALRQVSELTAKEAEGVSGVNPSDDGWTVTVDVIEDRRIPSTSDVLATYQAELGPDGELLSYQRVRRYARGRGDDGTS